MKRFILLAGALCAATAAAASEPRKPKKQEPAPPPLDERPLVDDARVGEEISEACFAFDAGGQTIDGRDNIVVLKTSDGGEAVLQLSGCSFNALMFASSFSAKDGVCASVGDSLVVGGYGDPAQCRIRHINRWRAERAHSLGAGEESGK